MYNYPKYILGYKRQHGNHAHLYINHSVYCYEIHWKYHNALWSQCTVCMYVDGLVCCNFSLLLSSWW